MTTNPSAAPQLRRVLPHYLRVGPALLIPDTRVRGVVIRTLLQVPIPNHVLWITRITKAIHVSGGPHIAVFRWGLG